MINVKWTYLAYRQVKGNLPISSSKLQDLAKVGNNAIKDPKTIVQSLEDFFKLFKDSTKEAIMNEVDFNGFKKIVEEKNAMPYDEKNPNFDTPSEIAEAKKIIQKYKESQKTL
jgi:hypothetical protein